MRSSGVRTWMPLQPRSAPKCLRPTPSARQLLPVATATWSKPYSSTSSAVSVAVEAFSTRGAGDLPAAVVARPGSRPPAPASALRGRPGRRAPASPPRDAPRSRAGPAPRAASSPAGPAPTTSTRAPDGSGAITLRMPAPPPLLAHRRVLRAADRRDREVAGHADVAADALADVLEPAFLDLLRQERVGDRRPGRADDVEDAARPPDHRVGRGEAPDADHRLRWSAP